MTDTMFPFCDHPSRAHMAGTILPCKYSHALHARTARTMFPFCSSWMKLPTYIRIHIFVILRAKSKNQAHSMHAHMEGTMFPFVIMMGDVVYIRLYRYICNLEYSHSTHAHMAGTMFPFVVTMGEVAYIHLYRDFCNLEDKV
jgi:hypothetical protein